MTLKQIKFNPFQHWEIISDLYKQSLCPYLIRELGVDFAVMSQTGQLVPFDYQDIFDYFSFGLGDISIRPINQQNIPYQNHTELKMLSN